jgi:predicted PurR-regulated permease PerM
MADLIELSRNQIPEWIADYLPESAEALQQTLTAWMREHAGQAKHIGEQTGRTIAHLIIGMVIGAMAALYDTTRIHHFKPLAAAMHKRVVNLHQAFRQIVFAQVQIAAINAIFTGVFLLLILPLAGIHLPFVKTMILVTFVAGLLPVIGNLISNTVIVVISLSHSLSTAGLALLFLVTIHKLEYFLNAKIVGTKINARAWELLSAMLVMEALFGIAGVIAAPVFYAYIKSELSQAELV